jgi:hypothetical protein
MLSRLDRAEILRRAELWLLWGDREQFTADDLRALLAELDMLQRKLDAARRAAQ